LPGLTRQSIAYKAAWRRWVDARVKPGNDGQQAPHDRATREEDGHPRLSVSEHASIAARSRPALSTSAGCVLTYPWPLA